MVGNRREYEVMNACECDLWWYRNLHLLILKTIKQDFGNNTSISIIDAGCGTGGLMEYLKSKGYSNIKGYDISSDAISFCKSKGLDTMQLDVKHIGDVAIEGSADVVISNDMLYFFEDVDKNYVLSQFYKILRPQGICIMNLPALRVFSGTHDLAVGITKRFEPKFVKQLLFNNKFKIQKMFFWPFLLSPMILIVRILQQLFVKPNLNKTVNSDVELPPKPINEFFYFLTKFESFLPFSRFFGSSIFIVGSK